MDSLSHKEVSYKHVYGTLTQSAQVVKDQMTTLAGRMALVGLGSNLGDSPRILSDATVRLADLGTVRRSALWRTLPVDCDIGAADFVNAVVRLEFSESCVAATMTPQALLQTLQEIEINFGRRHTGRNAPRYLDLDLLVLDDLCHTGDELTLPHPRALLRHFVLCPAAEVAPEYIWPGTGKTLRDLAKALPHTDWGERIN